LSEWNSNPAKKLWGKVINFKVQYFDQNQSIASHILSFDSYCTDGNSLAPFRDSYSFSCYCSCFCRAGGRSPPVGLGVTPWQNPPPPLGPTWKWTSMFTLLLVNLRIRGQVNMEMDFHVTAPLWAVGRRLALCCKLSCNVHGRVLAKCTWRLVLHPTDTGVAPIGVLGQCKSTHTFEPNP